MCHTDGYVAVHVDCDVEAVNVTVVASVGRIDVGDAGICNIICSSLCISSQYFSYID